MKLASDHQNQASTSYTIQSHGAKVGRFHLNDWLVMLALAVLEGLLQLSPPFNRFVNKHMMDDLRYPFKHNTIPIWSVPVYAVLFPIIIFAFYYFRRRNVYDLHNATLALLYAVGITAVITDAVKNAVGRPRPNFFWRCFPDGNENYDSIGNAICHGVDSVIREGHKSFPSGHSSMSFAGLTFLSLYLCGKMRVFDHKGHVAKLSVVSLPLLAATFVAISRVDDYWHHWQDVTVGGLLGIVVAYLCYHQFYPPPNDPNGPEPYGFLGAILEDQRQANNVAEESIESDSVDPEAHEIADDNNDPSIQNSHDHEITNDRNDPTIQNRHHHHEIDDTNEPSEAEDYDLEAQNNQSRA